MSYTTYGPVTGDCGHEHPTYDDAERCLTAHQLAVRRGNPGGGYSDRRIYESASAPRNLVGDVARVLGAPAERPKPGPAEANIKSVESDMGYLPEHTRRSVALEMTLRDDVTLREATAVCLRANRAYEAAEREHNVACGLRDCAKPQQLWNPEEWARVNEEISVAHAVVVPLQKLRDEASSAYKQAYDAVIADFDAAWGARVREVSA